MKLESKINCENQQATNKIVRNGWIELLRLIAITSVLFAHFTSTDDIVNKCWPHFEFGVVLFLLISGFCNYKSTKTRVGKFTIKILIYSFYAIIVQLIFCYGLKWDVVNPFIWLINFEVPQFGYSSYWYVYIYAFVSIFFVTINKWVIKFNKWKTLTVILVLLLCLYSWNWCFQNSNYLYYLYGLINIYQILFFVLVYSLGAWIAYYYKDKIVGNKKKVRYISLLFIILIAIFIIFLVDILDFFNNHNVRWWNFTTALVFILSISLLVLFSTFKPIQINNINKLFCYIGSITLAMYLMHAFVFIVLDHIYFKSPDNYDCGFYIGKFLTYFICSFIIAMFMTWFVSLHEKFIYKQYKKYKDSHVKNNIESDKQ